MIALQISFNCLILYRVFLRLYFTVFRYIISEACREIKFVLPQITKTYYVDSELLLYNTYVLIRFWRSPLGIIWTRPLLICFFNVVLWKAIIWIWLKETGMWNMESLPSSNKCFTVQYMHFLPQSMTDIIAGLVDV